MKVEKHFLHCSSHFGNGFLDGSSFSLVETDLDYLSQTALSYESSKTSYFDKHLGEKMFGRSTAFKGESERQKNDSPRQFSVSPFRFSSPAGAHVATELWIARQESRRALYAPAG